MQYLVTGGCGFIGSHFVRLLFGSIAAVFFFLVLFQDVLGIVKFS